MKLRTLLHPSLMALLVVACGLGSPLSALAAPVLPIAQEPLFRQASFPPLNMLVMGKDHKIYYEAYNDASDLNGDGVIEVGYKPALLDYYGNFDSHICYSHSGARFVPATATATKKCSGAWSGDYLNYLTTTRLDALRKVLYGGKRSTDTTTLTVLERTSIPPDGHVFGKEYNSVAIDGFNVAEYTPLAAPAAGRRHLFLNVSTSSTGAPLLRILNGTTFRIWNWASIEGGAYGVGLDTCFNATNNAVLCTTSGTRSDLIVRTEVCPSSATLREDNCKTYEPDAGGSISYKPTGILHDYGESNRMFFGLITGTQFNNTEGGVLRRNIEDFKTEVNPDTGVFLTTVRGIVHTLNQLRIVGFKYSNYFEYNTNCPDLGTRSLATGECRMWGNPLAEMMYESLRYFAGSGTGTPRFLAGGSAEGIAEEATGTLTNGEAAMNLPIVAWKDPYAAAGPAGSGFSTCAKPFQTLISDVNPSYDGGLPGNAFSEPAGTGTTPAEIGSFSAAGQGGTIWGHEFGGSRNVFIGQSGAVFDGAPSSKSAGSFGNIRGLSPEEPTKGGTYYSASVARFGFTNDINRAVDQQRLRTFSIALASPLPRVEFPSAGGSVTLVPFCKSVGGAFAIDPAAAFQPTCTIVDLYVERIVNFPGSPADPAINGGRPEAVFRINYEDVEQGNDHDLDAIALYTLRANAAGTITVTLNSEYAAGGVNQHMGYIISGTTNDGIYLEITDLRDGTNNVPSSATRYRLNTPPGLLPGACNTTPLSSGPAACASLPLNATRTFTPGATSGALLLRDPLWYAAKYGGFDDANNSGLPDGAPGALGAEWDQDRDSIPDNYFLVTNPATLRSQLEKAFSRISEDARPTGALTVTGARVGAGSLTYDAAFAVDASGRDWTGNVRAVAINADGSPGAVQWEAINRLPAESARNIFVGQSTGNAMTSQMAEFDAAALGGNDAAQLARMGLTRTMVNALFGSSTTVDMIVSYLRGDQTEEQPSGRFRLRSEVLGDIINSRPVIAGPKDDYGHGAPTDASPAAVAYAASYRAYLASKATRTPVVFIGANDGMLHAFNGRASGGEELFAFIPSSVVGKIGELPKPAYIHQYYVDGELNLGDAKLGSWKTVLVGSPGAGGKGVFALDVTDPTSFDENDLLWELTSADNNNIGQSIGKVEIMRGEDGNWYAAFGNGFNSVNANPTLMLVDLGTGLIVKELVANDGGAFSNGLGQIAALDLDFNGKVDTIYGGDLLGNVWKFDLRTTSSSGWQIAFGAGGATPLFKATDRTGAPQPVTGGFEIATGPENGILLYFGTGSYFLRGDNTVPANPPVQTIYGILDRNLAIVGSRSALQQQTIFSQGAGVAGSSVDIARDSTKNGVDYAVKKGFFLDLVVQPTGPAAPGLGERFVGIPRVQSGKVFFTTFQPAGTECNPGGINFLYGLDAISGAAALGNIRTGGTPGGAVCGSGCSGIALGDPNNDGGGGPTGEGGPGGPVKETVMIVPRPACVPGTPGCATPPRPVGGATGTLPAAINPPCSVIIRAANSPPFTLPRACGRQSWRQVR